MPTHGSLTKAGKVRSSTPKLVARPKTAPIPKMGNRRKFVKRFSLKRRVGQNWINV
ncbi:MAG: 30S ribosomal protein S30e [archaeon]|nr:30S ribosomal protein S30e [archaeon]MCP8315151.1 30S ribosomal protein S30e [archaeon]MCP8316168.1 30S ribosomal protein S30e [archaeon]MCP8319765.1 30S ribosomal protein S30e [archaeon]